MMSVTRLLGIAPQFLVNDVDAAIAHYLEKLGFQLDFTYEDFYASVKRDGFAIHLKDAASANVLSSRDRPSDHLDAYISVAGVRALYEELKARGADIVAPLAQQPWACVDFYVRDIDGNILCFSEGN